MVKCILSSYNTMFLCMINNHQTCAPSPPFLHIQQGRRCPGKIIIPSMIIIIAMVIIIITTIIIILIFTCLWNPGLGPAPALYFRVGVEELITPPLLL